MEPATITAIVAAAIPSVGWLISEITGISGAKSNSVLELGLNFLKAIFKALEKPI